MVTLAGLCFFILTAQLVYFITYYKQLDFKPHWKNLYLALLIGLWLFLACVLLTLISGQ